MTRVSISSNGVLKAGIAGLLILEALYALAWSGFNFLDPNYLEANVGDPTIWDRLSEGLPYLGVATGLFLAALAIANNWLRRAGAPARIAVLLIGAAGINFLVLLYTVGEFNKGDWSVAHSALIILQIMGFFLVGAYLLVDSMAFLWHRHATGKRSSTEGP